MAVFIIDNRQTQSRISKIGRKYQNLPAGAEGLEPSRTVLETVMLPLHYAPITIGVLGIEPRLPLYQSGLQKPLQHTPSKSVERRRIELRSSACKADVIPLYQHPIIKYPMRESNSPALVENQMTSPEVE